MTSLKIDQDFDYLPDDYWKWAAWIEGPEEELDQIDHVTYQLHPSFPHPVRTIKNRATKFRLQAAGWGGFRLYAKVVLKDGSEIILEHQVVLKYPDGAPTTA